MRLKAGGSCARKKETRLFGEREDKFVLAIGSTSVEEGDQTMRSWHVVKAVATEQS